MNRRLRAAFIMSVALSMLMLITSMTHYMFINLPDSLNTNAVVMDINARDIVIGFTPLMRAAEEGNLEYMQQLIAQGADLNALSANEDKDTALNIALINSVNGFRVYDAAKLLIESGADIHIANARGEQPIHTMLRITSNLDKRMEIMKMLMERGVDINAQTLRGETMMHIAVSLNSPEWFRMMRDNYGQIINLNLRTNEGLTVMGLAQKLGHVGDGLIGGVLNSWPKYIGYDFNIRAADAQGRTGIMLAILRGDEQFAKSLIDEIPRQKMDPKQMLAQQAENGNTALHYAVMSAKPAAFVKMLLEAGSPVDIVNRNGNTPLLLVSRIWKREQRVPVAKMLLEKGADSTYRNRKNLSAVELAALAQDGDLLKLYDEHLKAKIKK
jgi:ankyrin repeat protein